jgi:hypothetical protein
MKHALIFSLLLVVAPFVLHAQTMVMTPNSGSQGQDFSVSIVGKGTHFGTPQTVSMLSIRLERSGISYELLYAANVINDTLITAGIDVYNSMSGSYDLVIRITYQGSDTTVNNYIQDTAFNVTSAAPNITYVSPSSAYDSQTVSLWIEGQNTNFENGNSPSIYFIQNETTYFSAPADSINSATSLSTSFTLPANAPMGMYNVVVRNNVYSDTGLNKFRVKGPMPTVAIVPDSGMTSSTFDVSIVGVGTDFVPADGVSYPTSLNINLKKNGITYYHVYADTIFTSTFAKSLFSLSDSIAPGLYDAEIYGNSYVDSYDIYTTFLVTDHHTTIHIPHTYSVRPADTVTLKVSGQGVNFVYNGVPSVTTVKLVKGTVTIPAQSVKMTGDTSLAAFFSIPKDATAGLYDLIIVEPGTGKLDTGFSQFAVRGVYIDTSCTMGPDSGAQGQQLGGCLSKMDFGSATIDSMYLKQGSSIIPVLEQLRLPPCFPIGVDIPSSAKTGSYDLFIVLGGDAAGDTAVVNNAFTVLAAAGVDDLPMLADPVENIHVSPNPAQDVASISFTMNAQNHARLLIYDALGKTTVTLCDRIISAGTQNFAWSVSDMPAGSYFYELTVGDNKFGGRIVVNH